MIWLHDSTFRPRLRYHFQIHPSQQLLVYVLYPIVSHEYPLYPHIFRWLFSGRVGIHMKSPIFSRWSHDRCEEFGTLTVGERPTALGIACLKLPAEVWIRSEAVSCSSGNQKNPPNWMICLSCLVVQYMEDMLFYTMFLKYHGLLLPGMLFPIR